MSGRHAMKATSFATLSDSKVRTAAVALAAGAMFGAALPTGATASNSSGAQASAELTTSKDADNTATVDDAVTLGSSSKDFSVGQLVVEDSVAADNVALSLDVQLPGTSTSTQTQTNTAANAAPTPVQRNIAPLAEAGSIIAYARQFIGTPYVAGGGTPAGFDCSGFVSYVYAQAGYSLPHSSSAIRNTGTVIPASQAQPGDIMWWPGHVAIYTGSSQIEAVYYGTPLSENPIRPGATFIRVS